MDITYKDQIVAFVDVLGFSGLVNSGSNDALKGYFKYVLDEFSEDRKNYKFDYLLISDAIVIFTDSTKTNLEALCIAIGKLQMKLIVRGIIMRGGISFGSLFINREKNVIVGTALIYAYRLEREAVYPRVILDRGFIKLFYKNTTDLIDANLGRLVINPPSPYHADYPYVFFTRKLALVMQKAKLAAVVELLSKNLSENRSTEKYLWLKSHIEKGIVEQLNYLRKKPKSNNRDVRRIKILEDFKSEVEVL